MNFDGKEVWGKQVLNSFNDIDKKQKSYDEKTAVKVKDHKLSKVDKRLKDKISGFYVSGLKYKYLNTYLSLYFQVRLDYSTKDNIGSHINLEFAETKEKNSTKKTYAIKWKS